MNFWKPILLVIAVVMSCGKPDSESGAAIKLETDVMTVEGYSSSYTVAVTSESQWTAVPQVSWITSAYPTQEGNLEFSVEANPRLAAREGKIRLTLDGSSYVKDLTVRQKAYSEAPVEPVDGVKIEVHGAEVEVKVPEDSWKVKNVSAQWLTAAMRNKSTLTVSAEVNYTGESREAKVTITNGKQDEEIDVTQVYTASYFKFATTEQTRRLVHKLGDMVSSVASDRYVQVDEDLSYIHLSYSGPVAGTNQKSAFFLYEVDLSGNYDLLATCAKDDDSSIKRVDTELTDKDIIRQQLADLQSARKGIKVMGGVNADFFYVEESYGKGNLLHGVMWRRGVCLKDTFDGGVACTVFAMMKDGTAMIMSQTDYQTQKTNIAEAVGGRQRILKNGSVVSTTDERLEPRTAVGVTKDRQTVYLLVFDGRNNSWSTGATYDMMAEIFLAAGAWDATNLDGGGSSTFVLAKDGAAGTSVDDYSVLNKVSQGSERMVVNGIAIVRN